ncbi:DUF3617 domain-containing protein [Rhodobacteraceae bacterium]|nr:DUF3617 domain-containing protein [Paracoccaceae bacterium]
MAKIKILPTVTGLALALAVPTATTAEQRINLDPGLWQYATTLSVDGRGVVMQDTESFCIDAATANMSATDLVGLLTDGQCRASNAILTAGSGSAQMSCVYPEDNARGEGDISATFTTTTYDVQAKVTITGPGGASRANFVGNGRRVGDC